MLVRATPAAPKDEMRGVWTGPGGERRLSVRVAAPPEGGRANRAVCALLAKVFGLPKSAASITAGEKDRLKTVALAGDPHELAARAARLDSDIATEGEA